MPDVIDATEEDAARQALEDAGFTVRVVDEPVETPDEDGIVTEPGPRRRATPRRAARA